MSSSNDEKLNTNTHTTSMNLEPIINKRRVYQTEEFTPTDYNTLMKHLNYYADVEITGLMN